MAEQAGPPSRTLRHLQARMRRAERWWAWLFTVSALGLTAYLVERSPWPAYLAAHWPWR
ncbi:MAG: hypothetical protein OWV35_01450 [Firmicutes bacterium]|nr:hypothetical protein [Bacillota bacterium]